MSACNFSIPFNTTPEELSLKARHAIERAGGNFQGDSSTGNFSVSTPLGAIRGNYVIEGSLINVTISSKPFLVGCAVIENQLRSYFQTMA